MVIFFKNESVYYAVETRNEINEEDRRKLLWLFGKSELLEKQEIQGTFTGPRREMITPWSTNAVEMCQNMGIGGITRIEEFLEGTSISFDPMLQEHYAGLDQHIFKIAHVADPVFYIGDIAAYNQAQGLALSREEIVYLEGLAKKIGRQLTDSEVFGFSQVNSEHCRHKIFNGIFILDSRKMPETLFGLIRKTSALNQSLLVSAYKDNVAFIRGPQIEQFAPLHQERPDYFVIRDIQSVISLKAETHNFPTTVEPFNGAATGSGGEIRDRMAGGKGSIPMAGTAVYMTSYSRNDNGRKWEKNVKARKWLYKNPEELLIKASNGASDFGNKFGQALICGSVLTFEHSDEGRTYGYDKVIMLAGGIGFAKQEDSLKDVPGKDQKIIVLGGDNYRIGMGGGAVSSVATGEYENAIELNAVQRSNPEMQKRVFNAIRALCEAENNPVISIHDHGAGGHLNCLSELIEDTGGVIDIDNLPIGDPTLSDKEIISNESQERMGLVMRNEDAELLKKIASRERAPFYEAGITTDDNRLVFEDKKNEVRPIDLSLEDFFGKPPRTIIYDTAVHSSYPPLSYDSSNLNEYLESVLQLEAVACKDWLTNKVDRAVSGKIAKQQTCGSIQLPLNNLGVVALDYRGEKGIATALGHAPAAGLISPEAGSELSIAEALTNLLWAPLTYGLKGVSLSANWMWPCKNKGEDARLYNAVEAASRYAIELGINIPTGKDSLSMTQKYPDGTVVYSPGTVIISAVAEVSDVKKVVSPVLQNEPGTIIIYINMGGNGFPLGGSSFAQILSSIGNEAPHAMPANDFAKAFQSIQRLVNENQILSGHDISAGGMITSLLEMTFAGEQTGINVNLNSLGEEDLIRVLFSEKPGVLIQMRNNGSKVGDKIEFYGTDAFIIGEVITGNRKISLTHSDKTYSFDINHLRDKWFRTSYLLDRKQSGEKLALDRFNNYKVQPLQFSFSDSFTGKASQYGIDPDRRITSGIKAAIIREKGVNRDRDMASALYLAGFDVKDVHMTDLISGRETLEDINLIAFVGGFSNSDVLGSAKGWAGAFLYNEQARKTLENFFRRDDTLSLGVCNGCQLLVELGLIYPGHKEHPRMSWNDSHKYECTFVAVDILPNTSVMLKTLAGSSLGIWVAHGEGKFNFPLKEEEYQIPAKFRFSSYPGNPNGSMFDAACISSPDGRHLAIMPHLEDSVLPWQWAHYPGDRKNDEVTPWIEAFVNAREWVKEKLISKK